MFHACVAVFRAEPGRISQCLFNGGVFQSVQSVLLVDGGGCGITYLSSNYCCPLIAEKRLEDGKPEGRIAAGS